MTQTLEDAALIELVRRGRRSWQLYAELVEEAGSALAVLEREGIQEALFGPTLDASIEAAESDIRGWRQQGMELLTVLDRRYPENLRAVHDRPPFLFMAGQLQPGDARSVAVIGSRRASGAGIEAAQSIGAQLADAGYTVVSGLAAGIDTAVHRAALAGGHRTVAVVGTGLCHCYPPENAPLQRQIAAQCAVVSQFWPQAPPSRRSFPMRNAVMSGIALGTVIVEASETSGARIQARLALSQGRPVLLWRPLLSQQWARELASRPGIHVVASPDHITETIERLTASDALVG